VRSCPTLLRDVLSVISTYSSREVGARAMRGTFSVRARLLLSSPLTALTVVGRSILPTVLLG
jgi:hypothetical protein